MNEKDLFKKVIDENLLQREDIRRRVLNIVQIKNSKGVTFMKKKVWIAAISLVFVATISVAVYAAVDIYEYKQADSFLGEIGIKASTLPRSEAKKVYEDIKSDTFEYDATADVLNERAVEMGIEKIPQNPKDIYQAIVEHNGLIGTAKITSAQIKSIKTGTSFKDIVMLLGNSKDVGSGLHVLQYAVDGDKIFYLSFADENEICNKSGDELLKTLVDAIQDNPDENTFNATLVQRMDNNIFGFLPDF